MTLYYPNTTSGINPVIQKTLKNQQYGPIGGTNLCKEIMLSSPVTLELGVFYAPYIPGYPKTSASLKKLMPKYKFSRAKWHTVDIGSGEWRLSREYNEIIEWCTQQFGPHPKRQDAWSRWWVGVGTIYFRDSNDYVLYQLRWS